MLVSWSDFSHSSEKNDMSSALRQEDDNVTVGSTPFWHGTSNDATALVSNVLLSVEKIKFIYIYKTVYIV